ncbi:unnamed protein product [Adineta steineri]|uniref:Uncharacterized protein n=1 Tax=Adineta steineri TaxID=433720 RepID=A0A814KQL3_9BILA|nr:unnamed protein product [Adineta steineri]CAF1166897.1 unnamed protein product [Adineta steineri]
MRRIQSYESYQIVAIRKKPEETLTSLQTRDINLILSVVTNMGTTTMDAPLKPQEVHDLVNRTGRLITSYFQEFFPDDTQQTSPIPTTTNADNELINTSSDDTIEEPHTPIPLEQTTTKNKFNKIYLHHRNDLFFGVHTTAHCQKMIFSPTLLSTLKIQYKIGVTNISGMKSRFTAIIHEHALHLLNNNNYDHQQPPTVSSDNHLRIDFPKILGKVSRFDQFHFGATTKHTRLLSSSAIVLVIRTGSTDIKNVDDDVEPKKDQQTIPLTFTYKHWNEQRGAFTITTNDSTRLRSIVDVPASLTSNRELNLMF